MLADGIITGQCLGKEALAAFGLTNPILLGCMGLSGMMGVGTVIGIGKVFGRGERNKIQPILATSMAFSTILGIFLMLCLLCFPQGCARLLGAQPELLLQASSYLRGYSLSLPAFFLQCVLSYVMPLDGDKERVVAAMVTGTGVNIALDILNGTILKWGLYGMGLATSAGCWAALAVSLMHFCRKEKILHLSFSPFRFSALRNILSDGFPYAIQLMLRMLGIILINRIILSVFTSDEVAVFSVLMTCANLFLLDGTAVGVTVLTVDSCLAGEQDSHAIESFMQAALHHAVLVNTVLTVFFLLTAPAMLRLFTVNPYIYKAAVPAFRIFATGPVFFAVNFALRSHLQCISRTLPAMIYAAFDVMVFPVMVAFVLSRWVGPQGIWACYTLGEGLTLASLLLTAVIRNGRLSFHLKDYLFLDKTWVQTSDNCLEISIQNDTQALHKAVQASETAILFMQNHQSSKLNATIIGICVEELCTNIVRHGFARPTDTMEIRLIAEKDEWILRIRDNCRHFNLSDYFQIQEKHKDKLGLRIVRNLAQEVQYISMLKINQVIIRS
jgi:putative MATE family efflux protein